jgi:ATP-binding protein involved in chromosome partitioning
MTDTGATGSLAESAGSALETAVRAALDTVIDPELRLPLPELDMIGSLEIDAHGNAKVGVTLTVVGCPASARIQSEVHAAVSGVEGIKNVDVELGVMTPEQRAVLTTKLRAGRAARTNPFDESTLTKIFLIGSGKGGVGKSSITANLAAALAAKGLRVGLMDADIFGFSIPGQLGVTDKPTRVDDLILPPVIHGIKVISIGMFVDGNAPVAWRGPMLHRTINQFLTDVFWGDLDVLLVDLPPGTGDVAISLGQLLPTAKTVVVTTPQLAASDVAERSATVGLQTGQSVFGVIENMAWLEQADGTKLEIFGAGGGRLVADRLSAATGQNVPLLGQVGLSVALREGSDAGMPVVLSHPGDSAAAEILRIAELLAADPRQLAGRRLKLSV